MQGAVLLYFPSKDEWPTGPIAGEQRALGAIRLAGRGIAVTICELPPAEDGYHRFELRV